MVRKNKRNQVRRRYAKIAAQARDLATFADGDGDDAGSKLLSALMNDLGQDGQTAGGQQ